MQNNLNTVLTAISCQRQIRLKSQNHSLLEDCIVIHTGGQRVKTEQNKRLKTLQSQKFKLQNQKSRELIRSSNFSRVTLYKRRPSEQKICDYDEKSFSIQKAILSVKSPVSQSRIYASSIEKRSNCGRRIAFKKQLNQFNFDDGWSTTSSSDILILV